MKRFLLGLALVIISLVINAATKTWVGGSGALWNVPGNWAPSGVPVDGDDVIINTTGVVAINASPINLNSITITNNSTVLFNCDATRNITLSGTSSATPGLMITAGSGLTIDGSNIGTNNSTLLFTGAAGVIGSIYGTLIFSSSGGARSGNSIRMDTYTDAAHYGLVTVYSGGIIKILPDAGNTQTSSYPASPTFFMKESSTYENLKNGGSFPYGSWDPNALAKASSPGTNGPSFNGPGYGNLEWNCPNQTNLTFLNANVSFNNVTFISTNGAHFVVKTGASTGDFTMTINGNLIIGSNCYLEIISASSAPGTSGKISLKGHLVNHGTLGSAGIAGTRGQLELSGSASQNITNNGTIAGAKLEFIMNGVGATLLSPLTLPGDGSATGDDLQLLNGKIFSDAINILTLNDNATVSGGSTNSFISGPMRKVGDENFTFPVGTGSIYAPISLTNGSGTTTTDVFVAQYARANPQSTTPFGPNVGAGLDHVSYVEYWTLSQTNGTATKNVTLDVHPYSFCKVLANTYVGRWSGVNWNKISTSITTGPFPSGIYETGTIITTTAQAGFTAPLNAFTLCTDLSNDANPLPIDLVLFDAFKTGTAQSSIKWRLAACCSPSARFEVQKAGAEKNFRTIAIIAGNATNILYDYTDNGPVTGLNYYRLKMIDADGAVSFSRTVTIMNGVKGFLLTSLIPTIVTNSATLTISSSKQQKLDLLVVDMQGRAIRRQTVSVSDGNTNVKLFLSGLVSGLYQVTGITEEGKTNTIRFIK